MLCNSVGVQSIVDCTDQDSPYAIPPISMKKVYKINQVARSHNPAHFILTSHNSKQLLSSPTEPATERKSTRSHIIDPAPASQQIKITLNCTKQYSFNALKTVSHSPLESYSSALSNIENSKSNLEDIKNKCLNSMHLPTLENKSRNLSLPQLRPQRSIAQPKLGFNGCKILRRRNASILANCYSSNIAQIKACKLPGIFVKS